MSERPEKNPGPCERGPQWFRCIFEDGHADDCFGYRVTRPIPTDAGDPSCR